MEGSGGFNASSVVSDITSRLNNVESYYWQIIGAGIAVLVAIIIWKVIKRGAKSAT